jgi:uncharacterized membrane protein
MQTANRVRLSVIALAYAASLLVLGRLPSRMPHPVPLPDWAGRYWVALFLPTMAVCLWAIFRLLGARDPGRRHEAAAATYEALFTAAIVFVVGLHLILLATSLWPRPWLGRLLPLLLGTLMVIVGNVLPRLRPNPALGVRTPWALADEQVWARTHRAGGYLVAAWGLAMVATALAAPYVMVGGLMLMPLALVALSFAFSRDRHGATAG